MNHLQRLLAAMWLLLMLAIPADARRTVRHTAMCPISGYTATGYRTSTGTWPRTHHTAAVDPDVIPYGSHIHIAGLPWQYVAEDSGSAVWGAHVDIFVASVAEAYQMTGVRACSWV